MTSSLPLSPYVSLSKLFKRHEALCAATGGSLVQLGSSVLGEPIWASSYPCVGAESAAPPVRVLVCANIHGVEYIASEVALGFIEALSTPRALALRERAQVWVIPTLNPDAYARTWTLDGGVALKDVRCNARGVDLNRNYPRPAAPPAWALSLGGWGTGADDPSSAFYRGPAPLSEPETQALDALMATGGFIASANLHSTGGVLFPAHVKSQRELWRYRRLCAAFLSAQPRHRSWPLSSAWLDWFTGEQEDHQHHRYGCWSICVETFTSKARKAQSQRRPGLFWRFNPEDPRPWVENEVPGLLAYLLAACG